MDWTIPERSIDPPIGYMDDEVPTRDEWEEFYAEHHEFDDAEPDDLF